MPDIKCTNVSLGYDNNIIIKDLNLSVDRGDYLCIVGENGSGKSTLIKGILRLIKPISGKIEFGTKSLKVGYLPQQPLIQPDFPASVREVVLSGCSAARRHPFFSKSAKRLADYNMKRLGISDFSKRSISELSGGQRQKVFLARALCSGSDILLLDEPATGLDPIATAEMYDIIFKINRDSNVTITMVSHDISSVLKYATHILHIGNDESFFGTRDEYLKHPACKSLSVLGGDTDE